MNNHNEEDFDIDNFEFEGIVEEGNTLEDTNNIQEQLITTKWVEEAKQVPLSDCVIAEQQVILKCINQQPMNTEETETLQKVLSRYRNAILKHNPQETIENIEKNMEYNKNEKKFLKLLKQQKKAEKQLTMNYPLDDGTTYPLKLIVKKVDSESVTDLQTNLGLFQDFTQKEHEIRIKNQTKQPLTREEQAILREMNKKIESKVYENQIEVMTEFLAKQTRIEDEDYTYEDMKELYENMEFTYLEQLFEKVSTLSGLVTAKMDSLFQ